MRFILIGLGNPGRAYKNTRHNAGRIVLEHLVSNPPDGFSFSPLQENKKAGALTARGLFENEHELLVILPDTFMNLSGQPVKRILKYEPDGYELVVLHDDLDLVLGEMKIAFNRGTGGHKGVKSIAQKLGTGEFTRIKIGISTRDKEGVIQKPAGERGVSSFVTSSFTLWEKFGFKKVRTQVIEALAVLLREGRDKAMNRFN